MSDFILNLFIESNNEDNLNKTTQIIHTNKSDLFNEFKRQNECLPFPENYDVMNTQELYKFLISHDIHTNFALINIKILDNPLNNEISLEYNAECYLYIINLINKFQRISGLKFTTIDIKNTFIKLNNEINKNKNNLQFYFNNDNKYTNDDKLSNIELLILFYLSLFIQLMINGKEQQSEINQRIKNNIICLSYLKLKNIPLIKLKYIINKYSYNTNKNIVKNINNLYKLLNLNDNYFDKTDMKNQYYIYICNLLINKIIFNLKQKRNRTFMINVSNELQKIHNNELLNKINEYL